MSYNITFKVKADGTNCYVPVGDCEANITYNVRKIIELSTGLSWINGDNNGLAKDIIPSIEKGYNELINYPEKYKQYESPNGWGTVESTRRFFKLILEAWSAFCRWSDEDLVNVTTFWIE